MGSNITPPPFKKTVGDVLDTHTLLINDQATTVGHYEDGRFIWFKQDFPFNADPLFIPNKVLRKALSIGELTDISRDSENAFLNVMDEQENSHSFSFDVYNEKDFESFVNISPVHRKIVKSYKVKVSGLPGAIKRCKYACAADNDPRNYLSGIQIEVSDGVANLVATDGIRLNFETLPAEVEGEITGFKFNFPRKFLRFITSETFYLVRYGDTLSVEFPYCGSSSVCCDNNDVADNFPATWKRTIPSTPVSIAVNRKELLNNLESLHLEMEELGNENWQKYSVIKLETENDCLKVQPGENYLKQEIIKDGDMPGFSIDRSVLSEVDNRTTHVNISYLKDALKSSEEESVSLAISGYPFTAIRIDNNKVLMPVRI